MKPIGLRISLLWHFAIAAIAFWLGIFMFPDSSDRMPASTASEIYDYSGYDTKEFKEKASLTILEKAQFIKGSDTYRVQLGHVYGPGRSISMCETYKKIAIVLKAEGMAVHGEVPSITITAPCTAENAATLTNEIVIPFKELTAEKAEDGEFEYENMKILVAHLDGEWPYQMYVDSISFLGGKGLHISLSDIRHIKRSNITLDW